MLQAIEGIRNEDIIQEYRSRWTEHINRLEESRLLKMIRCTSRKEEVILETLEKMIVVLM